MEKVRFKSLGHNLVGIVEYPQKTPAPGMILCHGLSNTKEDCPLIEETTKMLIDTGFITFRFDYFGSGESPGTMKDKTISILEQNTKDAIDFFLSDEKVTEVGMWGRSFGGTLVALCGSDPRINASIIASGVFFLKKVFDREKIDELVKKEEEMEQMGGKLAGTGHYKGKYGLNDMWYVECGEYEDKLIRNLEQMSGVLVLGTSPDEKVPSENSIAIYNIVKNPKEIHIFGNTSHAYEGAENEALSLMRRWIKIHMR
jgi:esterase/lipase